MRGSHVSFVMRAFSLVPHSLVCAWRGGKDVPARIGFQKSPIFKRARQGCALSSILHNVVRMRQGGRIAVWLCGCTLLDAAGSITITYGYTVTAPPTLMPYVPSTSTDSTLSPTVVPSSSSSVISPSAAPSSLTPYTSSAPTPEPTTPETVNISPSSIRWSFLLPLLAVSAVAWSFRSSSRRCLCLPNDSTTPDEIILDTQDDDHTSVAGDRDTDVELVPVQTWHSHDWTDAGDDPMEQVPRAGSDYVDGYSEILADFVALNDF